MIKKLLVIALACGAGYFLYTRVWEMYLRPGGPPPSLTRTGPIEPAKPLVFATVAQAQRAATMRYPALAVARSEFHKAYTTRYSRYMQDHPNYFKNTSWPLQLAAEVNQALPVPPPPRNFTAALDAAKGVPSMVLGIGDAFSLAELEEAKAKAIAEKKPLGFIMVWGQFFGARPANTRHEGGESATVHFYMAFRDTLVLVFVRHEGELDKVPDAVQEGFGGPDEGGFAPNMAVVDATASEFIVEIPLGGDHSDGPKRDAVFTEGAAKITTWLASHPDAVAKTGVKGLLDKVMHPSSSP